MHGTSHIRPIRTRRTVATGDGRERTIYRPRPSRGVELRRALAEQMGTVR
jgi:hypothetical protein